MTGAITLAIRLAILALAIGARRSTNGARGASARRTNAASPAQHAAKERGAPTLASNKFVKHSFAAGASALLLVIAAVAVLMIVDDPLPYRRLSIEWLTVLIEGHFSSDPTNLWPVLRPASLLGALKAPHVCVSEAWQA
jgi:hypothetical protein